MILRDFLYLDRPLVREFLAQAEGGAVDEATERERRSGKGGIGGRLGTGPVAVGAEKSKEHILETETIVHQVASSEFDRLYRFLESNDLIIFDEVSEPSVLRQIRRKQFLEIDSRVRSSGIHQLLKLFSAFQELAPLMKELGTGVLDDESSEGVRAILGLAGLDRVVPVIAYVPGPAEFKVGLELNPVYANVDSWDVEASVLLKVQRVLRKDERYLLGDPMGGIVKLISQRDREKFFEALRSSQAQMLGISGDVELQAPALIGTPIAIYR